MKMCNKSGVWLNTLSLNGTGISPIKGRKYYAGNGELTVFLLRILTCLKYLKHV